MVLEFYYDLVSSGCRAVYLLLKEGGVPFEPKLTELQKGQHLEREFLKKNPFHKIPTIDNNGYILTESAAIMKYIAIKYELGIHWYPWDSVEKCSKVDEYLHWHHLNIRKGFLTILLELAPTRIDNFLGIPKRPANEALVSATKAEFAESITHIAKYFLGDKDFIAGNEISIADLSGVAELIGLRAVNEEAIYESNEVVGDWVKRVEERMKNHFSAACLSIEDIKKEFNSEPQE